MKWSLPILPVYLFVALIINAQIASSIFGTYTGGNLNAWLYLTSFAQDRDLLEIGIKASSAMLVMGMKYILMVLIALSFIYTVGKNLHNGIIYGIEILLSKKEHKKETVEG